MKPTSEQLAELKALPEPAQKQQFYCSKCGSHGAGDGTIHMRANGSGVCDYMASSTGPYYTTEQMQVYANAVTAALLADLEEETTSTSHYKDVAEQINSELELVRAEKDIVRGFVTERDGIIARMQTELAATRQQLEEVRRQKDADYSGMARDLDELQTVRQQLAEAQAFSRKQFEAIRSLEKFASSVASSSSYWKEAWPVFEDVMCATEDEALQSAISAAVEPYKRDAERLDYIQATQSTVSLHVSVENFDFVIGGLLITKNANVRAAIDAALSAKESTCSGQKGRELN